MREKWFISLSTMTTWAVICAALALGCDRKRPTFDFNSVVGYQLQLLDESGNMITGRSVKSGRRELKVKSPFSIRGRIFSPASIEAKVVAKVVSFEKPNTPITTTNRLVELVPGEPNHYAYEIFLKGVPKPGPYLVQVILVGDPLSELSFSAVHSLAGDR